MQEQERPPLSVTMRLMRKVRRITIIVIGFTLIVFGFLLGFVPGIPGWPLGLLGLSMLAGEYVWARRMMRRVKRGAHRLRDVFLPKRRPPDGSGAQPVPVPRE